MNIARTAFVLVVFHCAYGQSIACSNVAETQTGSKIGPGGVIAVLKVQTHDDHMKNSHECMAEYHLHITLPDGHEESPERGCGFTNRQAEWGRRVSVHLDGFSNDGQHVFGVISEGGQYSFVQAFDFKRGGPQVATTVQQGLSHLNAVKCGTSFAVAGTTNAGEIVLEPNTANQCRIDHRWVLDRAGKLRELAKNESLTALYNRPRQ